MNINHDRYLSPAEAEHHIKMFHEYLTAISSKQTKMYSKSLDKYEQMRNITSECLEMMNAILSANGRTESLVSSGRGTVAIYFDKISNIKVSALSAPRYARDFLVTFCQWFEYRFTTKRANPKFLYNSDNIGKWVDMFIISYCYYLNSGKIDEFESLFDKWLATLSDESVKQFPLFKEAAEHGSSVFNVSPEAVVLEHYLKESLYTVDFFPEYQYTVLKAYQSTWENISYEEIRKISKIK